MIMKKIIIAPLITAIFALVLVFVPTELKAATSCNFTRDLDMGVDGEDVRCLQQYLNEAGFVVSTSGVGSPGNETSLFRTLTQEAVKAWQRTNGISPASGYFGPLSRGKYNALRGGIASTLGSENSANKIPSIVGINQNEVAEFLKQLNNPNSSSDSSNQKQITARERIKRAINEIKNEDDYSEDEVENGISKLFSAFLEFIDGKFGESIIEADLAYDAVNNKDVDEDELEDDIEDIKNKLDDARDEVEDADEEEYDIDNAEEYLDDAEDLIDDAEKAFDDEEYSDARDNLNDAEEKIEKALEEIGQDPEQEAENAINDAKEKIDEAESAIDDADDEGEDVDTAEELLKAAEEKLDDAEDAFEDEDWAEAKKDAEDAEDLAKDAIDELD